VWDAGVLREPLPHHQWSAEDVANWQYVNSLWRYPRALYEAGVDGPTLLTLCDPINATALKDSDAVLSWAVDRGLRPVVARALELGADPNRADEFGATLLMEAAWQGSAELSETLLAAGAAVDLQNSNGYTALMRAALRGNAKVVRMTTLRCSCGSAIVTSFVIHSMLATQASFRQQRIALCVD
jgi:hypothetical protein